MKYQTVYIPQTIYIILYIVHYTQMESIFNLERVKSGKIETVTKEWKIQEGKRMLRQTVIICNPTRRMAAI